MSGYCIIQAPALFFSAFALAGDNTCLEQKLGAMQLLAKAQSLLGAPRPLGTGGEALLSISTSRG